MTSNSTAKTPSTGPFRAVQICLAVLLLTAAGLKTHELATGPVMGTGLLESRWFLVAVVEFELFFGLWLLGGYIPDWTWRASIVLFATFACVSLSRALTGEASCGCFGRVSVSPWFTFVLDLLIVYALLCVRASVRSLPVDASDYRASRFRLAMMASAWLIVGVSSGVAMGSYRPVSLSTAGSVIGDGHIVVLEPDDWIGKPFPLLDWIDIDARLDDGRWTVVLHRPGCSTCEEVLRRFEEMPYASRSDSIGFVELPSARRDHGPASRHVRGIHHGRLNDRYDWFVEVPLRIGLRNGEVVDVEKRQSFTVVPDAVKHSTANKL